jgi:hypothetical protein
MDLIVYTCLSSIFLLCFECGCTLNVGVQTCVGDKSADLWAHCNRLSQTLPFLEREKEMQSIKVSENYIHR